VPAAVLLELYRGGGTDEAIDQELGRGYARVVTTGARTARLAGHALAAIGAGSEHAVDALVLATAVRLGGGLILTHDPGDLQRLAVDHPNVLIVPI
jgi:predicted nucleic acid-binding protein